MKLKRNVRATVLPNFDVIQNDNTVLNGDDNYFIYMKNVNLQPNGVIVGRYLGEASDSLIDGYCRDAVYNDGVGFEVDGERIRVARMLAVKNYEDKRVIVVIQ